VQVSEPTVHIRDLAGGLTATNAEPHGDTKNELSFGTLGKEARSTSSF